MSPERTAASNRGASMFVLWRDLIFVICGSIALQVCFLVESSAGGAPSPGGLLKAFVTHFSPGVPKSTEAIVDSGFFITTPLYLYLKDHRDMNDCLAGLNSFFLLIATFYAIKVTFWHADYTLAFRLIAVQLFRSFCGWFTYLPPSKEFLLSYYDYPEAIYCVTGTADCSKDPSEEPSLPFVTFFSGHVAMATIIANHMYVRGLYRPALLLHLLNVFQCVRLLATRGHYSIDLIIGWVVAVYVSNPAERLGRYYSRGGLQTVARDLRSGKINQHLTAKNAFEAFAGVHDVTLGTRIDGDDGSDFDTDGDEDGGHVAGVSSAKLASEMMRKSAHRARELMADLQKTDLSRMNKQEVLKMFGEYQDAVRKQIPDMSHLNREEVVKLFGQYQEAVGQVLTEDGRKRLSASGRAYLNLNGGFASDTDLFTAGVNAAGGAADKAPNASRRPSSPRTKKAAN